MDTLAVDTFNESLLPIPQNRKRRHHWYDTKPIRTTSLYPYSTILRTSSDSSIGPLSWYWFDAHIKDKGYNRLHFTFTSLWYVTKWRNSGELMNPCRCHNFTAEAISSLICFYNLRQVLISIWDEKRYIKFKHVKFGAYLFLSKTPWAQFSGTYATSFYTIWVQ